MVAGVREPFCASTVAPGNTHALRVAVDGETTAVWLGGDGGEVSEGDSVTPDAGPGATVTVVWVPPGSDVGSSSTHSPSRGKAP